MALLVHSLWLGRCGIGCRMTRCRWTAVGGPNVGRQAWVAWDRARDRMRVGVGVGPPTSGRGEGSGSCSCDELLWHHDVASDRHDAGDAGRPGRGDARPGHRRRPHPRRRGRVGTQSRYRADRPPLRAARRSDPASDDLADRDMLARRGPRLPRRRAYRHRRVCAYDAIWRERRRACWSLPGRERSVAVLAPLSSTELLEVADLLVNQDDAARPQPPSLRRAVSSAYYALFHELVGDSVHRVAGTGPATQAQRNAVSRWYSHS